MFCGKCGTKNETNMKFCGKCGTQIEGVASPTGGTPPVTVNTGRVGVLDLGGVVKLDASNEDNATLTIAGLSLPVGLMFKIISALLVVALILPFFSFGVRIMGITMSDSLNGFTAITGGDGGSGTITAVFLLLIPIAIFALFQFSKALTFLKGKLFMFSTGLTVLGFIMLFIVRGSLRSSLQGGFVDGLAGFIISIILYIAATIISAGFLVAGMKK